MRFKPDDWRERSAMHACSTKAQLLSSMWPRNANVNIDKHHLSPNLTKRIPLNTPYSSPLYNPL